MKQKTDLEYIQELLSKADDFAISMDEQISKLYKTLEEREKEILDLNKQVEALQDQLSDIQSMELPELV